MTTIILPLDPARPGCIKSDAPNSPKAQPVAFAEAGPGYTVTKEAADHLARAKAYAERHGMPLVLACQRMEDPQLAELDEWQTKGREYAAKTGCPLIEALAQFAPVGQP